MLRNAMENGFSSCLEQLGLDDFAKEAGLRETLGKSKTVKKFGDFIYRNTTHGKAEIKAHKADKARRRKFKFGLGMAGGAAVGAGGAHLATRPHDQDTGDHDYED